MIFKDAHTALEFIRGGNAYVTIKSLTTGRHYTYRFRKANDGDVYFASLLTAPDVYTYMGILDDRGIRVTKKSTYTADSTPVAAFNWLYAFLLKGQLPTIAEIRHDGRCGRCARQLTVPESVDSGFGPECRQYVCEAA